MSDRRATTWPHRMGFVIPANLFVVLIVLWLVGRPQRFTIGPFTQIRVGMTLDEARTRLGPSRSLNRYELVFIPAIITGRRGYVPRDKPLGPILKRPAMIELVPGSVIYPKIISTAYPPTDTEIKQASQDKTQWHRHHLWLGSDHLLWVLVDEHEVIQQTWVLPIREEGGFLDWLNQQYQSWFTRSAPTVPVTAPAPTGK